MTSQSNYECHILSSNQPTTHTIITCRQMHHHLPPLSRYANVGSVFSALVTHQCKLTRKWQRPLPLPRWPLSTYAHADLESSVLMTHRCKLTHIWQRPLPLPPLSRYAHVDSESSALVTHHSWHPDQLYRPPVENLVQIDNIFSYTDEILLYSKIFTDTFYFHFIYTYM